MEIRTVRFFCLKCGKEMWLGKPVVELWKVNKKLTFKELEYSLECTDCMLAEIRKECNESISS